MKITFQGVHCYAKTESDEDEIYCVVSSGSDRSRRELARVEVGSFEIGRDLQREILIWEGPSHPDMTITVMESDADEPAYGSDDFIGEITVSADGSCKPGHGTLDEGFDEGKRYRRFSMTGSGAHYVLQLEVRA